MLLLVAIVQMTDAPVVTDALLDQGLRLTRIGSTGGLLGTGNVVLMLGLDESKYEDAVSTITRTCKTRVEHMSSVAMLDPDFPYITSTEVEVGGAVVFAIPVERFVRIPDDSNQPAGNYSEKETRSMTTSRTEEAVQAPMGGDGEMKLVVAVVKSDDVDAVITTLLEAGHRLTRINTTGGFLRRGNATLLIGVHASKLDEVVSLIEAACPSRPEPAPLEKGLPMYSATLFVLDSSHFVRV